MAKRVRLLAFDTSSSACSVALLDTNKDKNKQVTALHKNLPMQQGRLILPMINELLNAASVSLNELDAIAYGCGPGSFTGIRIASSVAQGLGFATKCPIISVSSLAAIAQSAYLEKKWTSLLVAVDARIGEVYWAHYTVNPLGNMELNGKEQVCPPEAVELPIQNHSYYGVGEGWEKYGEKFAKLLGHQLQAIDKSQLPTAEGILPLAKAKLEIKDWISASNAIPVYLR